MPETGENEVFEQMDRALVGGQFERVVAIRQGLVQECNRSYEGGAHHRERRTTLRIENAKRGQGATPVEQGGPVVGSQDEGLLISLQGRGPLVRGRGGVADLRLPARGVGVAARALVLVVTPFRQEPIQVELGRAPELGHFAVVGLAQMPVVDFFGRQDVVRRVLRMQPSQNPAPAPDPAGASACPCGRCADRPGPRLAEQAPRPDGRPDSIPRCARWNPCCW